MSHLLQRLNDLASRHHHFVFDLRGECRVLYGIAAAYRMDEPTGQQPQLVIAEALRQDGVISVSVDPRTGAPVYARCRLFTASEQALRFAQEQGCSTIYNLNRACEMRVPVASRPEALTLQPS